MWGCHSGAFQIAGTGAGVYIMQVIRGFFFVGMVRKTSVCGNNYAYLVSL